ncbi:MAG: CoA-transferase subunit beta [Verrucomicrobia bacterium]|nr:CoA-transferase subunit beta [Verrucomicrobiota bacterium]
MKTLVSSAPENLAYSPSEMMHIAAARLLTDQDVCLVGIGAPSTACNLARLTHAPRIKLIYESGTIDTRPDILPLSIGDGILCDQALTTVSLPEIFQYWLQAGRISVGFLGGAQIDRYANLNTSVIGDYFHPKVRLPGAGGAPEIAAGCGRTFVIMEMNPRRFVEKLDFRTTLGFGRGLRDRWELGLQTNGPTAVVTDLCVLAPDPVTHELMVVTLHPGVDAADISKSCGWSVRFAADLEETPPPTTRELKVLRDLEERTAIAHSNAD